MDGHQPVSSGVKVTQKADQSGCVRANGEQRRGRLRPYRRHSKRAAGIEVVFIRVALDLDMAGAKLIHGFRFLSVGLFLHSHILYGYEKAQTT